MYTCVVAVTARPRCLPLARLPPPPPRSRRPRAAGTRLAARQTRSSSSRSPYARSPAGREARRRQGRGIGAPGLGLRMPPAATGRPGKRVARRSLRFVALPPPVGFGPDLWPPPIFSSVCDDEQSPLVMQTSLPRGTLRHVLRPPTTTPSVARSRRRTVVTLGALRSLQDCGRIHARALATSGALRLCKTLGECMVAGR